MAEQSGAEAEVDYGEVDYGENEEGLGQEYDAGAQAADAAAEEQPADETGAASAAGRDLVEQPPPIQPRPPAQPQGQPAGVAAAALTGVEEWEQMEIPEGWRPLPLLRVWGVHPETTEDELKALMWQAGVDDVRSVAFDPKQETTRGKVGFVRLHPPPLAWGEEARRAAPTAGATANGSSSGAAPEAADVQKVAERAVARLRAQQQPPLQLRGQDLHFERTSAEVTLFLANVTSSDEDLRARCEPYGTLERCFIMRNPAGQSKSYGFVEYSAPSAATACREAWARTAEEQRRPRPDPGGGGGPRPDKVKLQRAEPGAVRTVQAMFANSLFVDNLPTVSPGQQQACRTEAAAAGHCVCVCVRVCVRACVGACVRACVRA